MRYTFVCVAAALTLPLHKRSLKDFDRSFLIQLRLKAFDRSFVIQLRLKAFDRSFVIRCKGITISSTELEITSTLKGTVTSPSPAIPFELAAAS